MPISCLFVGALDVGDAAGSVAAIVAVENAEAAANELAGVGFRNTVASPSPDPYP